MKKIVLVFFVVLMVFGCKQKEEPKQQYQFPSGPVQSQDDVKLLREVVQKDPANLNAWIKLGNVLMDNSRYAEAVEAYQKALDIDPKNVDVRVDMGTCLRYSGRSDRAIEEYKKALQYNPNHLYGHKNMAIVLAYDFNRNAEAIKAFEKYLELAPGAPDAAQVREEIKRLKALK